MLAGQLLHNWYVIIAAVYTLRSPFLKAGRYEKHWGVLYTSKAPN